MENGHKAETLRLRYGFRKAREPPFEETLKLFYFYLFILFLIFNKEIIMCTVIGLQRGVVALLGDCAQNRSMEDLAKKIDLYIQYGNNAMRPIQIQIDAKQLEKESDEKFYIELLKEHEPMATVYNVLKEKV